MKNPSPPKDTYLWGAQGIFANGTLKCCGSMIARRII